MKNTLQDTDCCKSESMACTMYLLSFRSDNSNRSWQRRVPKVVNCGRRARDEDRGDGLNSGYTRSTAVSMRSRHELYQTTYLRSAGNVHLAARRLCVRFRREDDAR
jgi:hypothetical protein